MADTSVNHKAECWVVEAGLSQHWPETKFAPAKLKLTWGGVFAFDAVSEDQGIVVAISTSAARTASGKLATAKYQKLKTDALYLLHLAVPAERVMVFTEPCMREYFVQAAKAGRFPPNIMLLHISLPPEIQANVVATRALASKETSPSKLTNAA